MDRKSIFAACLMLPMLLTGCGAEYRMARYVSEVDRKYKPYINLSEADSILQNKVVYNSCMAREESNMASSSKKLAEEGYLLAGDVISNRGRYNTNIVKAHCGVIGAEIALWDSTLTSSTQVNIPLTVPQVSYANTTYQGNLGNYTGSSKTTFTQYVRRDISYQVNTYRHWVTYWVKGKPPILGAYYDKMSDLAKYETETNSGAYVYLVVNGSPAFKNDVIVGDVIIQVDDDRIVTPEDLTRVLLQKAGKEIVLHIIRKGEPKNITLTLNQPNG